MYQAQWIRRLLAVVAAFGTASCAQLYGSVAVQFYKDEYWYKYPLHYACGSSKVDIKMRTNAAFEQIRSHWKSNENELLSSVGKRDTYGDIALLACVENGDSMFWLTKKLIESGEDINGIDNNGKSILVLLASVGARDEKGGFSQDKGGFSQTADYLISKGANVNYINQNARHSTLLHAAASSGNVKAIQYFEKYSSDYKAKNKFGETPVMMAVEAASPQAFSYLLEKGSTFDPSAKSSDAFLVESVKRKDFSPVALFLLNGVSINEQHDSGENVIEIAAAAKSNDILEALLKAGGSPGSMEKTISTLLQDQSGEQTVRILLRYNIKLPPVYEYALADAKKGNIDKATFWMSAGSKYGIKPDGAKQEAEKIITAHYAELERQRLARIEADRRYQASSYSSQTTQGSKVYQCKYRCYWRPGFLEKYTDYFGTKINADDPYDAKTKAERYANKQCATMSNSYTNILGAVVTQELMSSNVECE